MIEIYAVAWLRDVQIGSVRVLISNVQIDVQIVSTPSSLPPASASTTSSTPRPPPGVRRISRRRPPMLVVPIPIGTIPLLTDTYQWLPYHYSLVPLSSNTTVICFFLLFSTGTATNASGSATSASSVVLFSTGIVVLVAYH
ncbi:unnamed protein product [Linum trigynum]|uniref:Uncharacterized protein n=1 Tax=Linum trigynum TaxID=586398 RepID=A0AAV2D1F3_9ROSI